MALAVPALPEPPMVASLATEEEKACLFFAFKLTSSIYLMHSSRGHPVTAPFAALGGHPTAAVSWLPVYYLHAGNLLAGRGEG